MQVQMSSNQAHFGPQHTFSPNINKKSRSLSRTVKDLYTWNDQKKGSLKLKREQGSTHKVKICPGSAAIINNSNFSTTNIHNRSSKYKSPNQDIINDRIILLTDKRKNEKKALKNNKLKIKASKPVKRRKNIAKKPSLKTISEVSSTASNQALGRADLRNLSYRGSTSSENQSYNHSRDSTREKLDRFYMSGSPN